MVFKYLKSIQLTEYTTLIYTNLESVIYSSNTKDTLGNNALSKKILVELLHVYSGIIPKYNEDVIDIFEDNSKNQKYVTQLILPLKNCGDYLGSIILLSTKNEVGIEAMEFLTTIRRTLEAYLKTENLDRIKKFENNPLYNKKILNQIIDLYDQKKQLHIVYGTAVGSKLKNFIKMDVD